MKKLALSLFLSIAVLSSNFTNTFSNDSNNLDFINSNLRNINKSSYDVLFEFVLLMQKHNGNVNQVKTDPEFIKIKPKLINTLNAIKLEAANILNENKDHVDIIKALLIYKINEFPKYPAFKNIQNTGIKTINSGFNFIDEIFKFINVLVYELDHNPDLIYLLS